MIELLTATEMAALDRETIDQVGIPGLGLMEIAADGCARCLRERFGERAASLRSEGRPPRKRAPGGGAAIGRHVAFHHPCFSRLRGTVVKEAFQVVRTAHQGRDERGDTPLIAG